MYFNADFAMQTSPEYIRYDIEEYYCPKSSIFYEKSTCKHDFDRKLLL